VATIFAVITDTIMDATIVDIYLTSFWISK